MPEMFLFQLSPQPLASYPFQAWVRGYRLYYVIVVEPEKVAWKMIVKNFGHDILLENGHIDRLCRNWGIKIDHDSLRG